MQQNQSTKEKNAVSFQCNVMWCIIKSLLLNNIALFFLSFLSSLFFFYRKWLCCIFSFDVSGLFKVISNIKHILLLDCKWRERQRIKTLINSTNASAKYMTKRNANCEFVLIRKIETGRESKSDDNTQIVLSNGILSDDFYFIFSFFLDRDNNCSAYKLAVTT